MRVIMLQVNEERDRVSGGKSERAGYVQCYASTDELNKNRSSFSGGRTSSIHFARSIDNMIAVKKFLARVVPR